LLISAEKVLSKLTINEAKRYCHYYDIADGSLIFKFCEFLKKLFEKTVNE